MPGLDGLRGLAVLGVLLFHAELGWAGGGYLAITAFFVLSGFLITSLLLVEHGGTGRIARLAFWARRARRLVPAALIGLALAGAYAAAVRASDRFEGDALAALTWLTNWRLIGEGTSYAQLFSEPSPLQHYWSLAVEEQFYLTLPLLAGAVLWGGRGRRWPLAATAAALAVLSAAAGALGHDPGEVPLRSYYGTDARAAELLVGVLLALALTGPSGVRLLGPSARRLAGAAGGVALAATLALWSTVDGFPDWLFEGGLAAVAGVAALVVVAATQPATAVARLLAAAPLAALGRISYGAYVYHWPVYLWLSPERTGLGTVPLLAVRLAVVAALAALSYRFVELPIRRGGLPRHVAPLGWATGAAAAMGVVALSVVSLPPAPAVTLRSADEAPGPPPVEMEAPSLPAPVAAPAPATPPPTSAPVAIGAAAAPTAPTPVAAPAAPQETIPLAAGSGEPPPPPPAAAAPTTAPPQPGSPATTAPAPVPLRVMVFGDSLANNLATGLTRLAKRTGEMVVWDHGASGCPVGRDAARRHDKGDFPVKAHCGWWGTDEARQEIADFRPEVVLVVAGMNDIFDRKKPEWPDWMAPGDAIYDAWLSSEYADAGAVLSSTGAPIVWAPPPCLDWGYLAGYMAADEGERRRQHHNRVILPATRARSPYTLADLEGQLCPDGGFERDALGVENARPDGLHLSDEAAEVLAERWLAPLLHDAAGR